MAWLYSRGSQGPQVRALRAKLAASLGDDALDYPGLQRGMLFDALTEAAVRRWQSGVGLVADGVVGPYALALLGLRSPAALTVPTTARVVRQLFPATKPANVQRYLPYVAAALGAAGLVDRDMVGVALGTIRAECEGFLPVSEQPSPSNTLPGLAPFSAYEGRQAFGHLEPGDGARFRGRGFVQITGRAAYTRCAAWLGVDIVAQPDLANAPEVAAVLLALFLSEQQPALRAALAAGDLTAARQCVNGGAHGQARFDAVWRDAQALWAAPAAPAVGARRQRARVGQAAAAGAATGTDATTTPTVAPTTASRPRTLAVRKDPTDLRDRPYQPPPVTLADAFPSDADIARFVPAYTRAKLILDQGEEGACTGFGLACVVNHLRWRKAGLPQEFRSVSARMLYHFARRYDEYAGEDYDGSSCRGALKGWFHHGVCLEDDWPYGDASLKPLYGYAQRAAQTTLGVYYRIELGSISDVQAAIQQVGAVYVSAYTHEGWDDVPQRRAAPKGHAQIPLIAFDGRPSKKDGHAFALVGFNAQGFVVQNSWGPGWGLGGFAVLSYADWLANAMDAWVVAMGVPGVVAGQVAAGPASKVATGAAAAAEAASRSPWWSEERAYRHSVLLGHDGRVQRYLTEDEFSRTLLQQVAVLPDAWFRRQPAGEPRRLLIYAHGGLGSEAQAIMRARALGRHFAGNGCYPLFVVWKTGLLESLRQIVEDALRRQPVRAGAGLGEVPPVRSDLMLEKTIGRTLARPLWSEMKESAELAFGAGRGGDLLITALQRLADTWGDLLQIHLVGHSAGAILLGHLLSALSARGLPAARVASVHLHAPACTVQFANRHYAAQPQVMQRLHLHLLSDRLERDDEVAGVYRKSLLYFVSNALEIDLRTPLLGLAQVLDADYAGWDGTSSVGAALRQWRSAVDSAGLVEGGRVHLVDRDKITVARAADGAPLQSITAGHASFDHDVEVIETTLQGILGGALRQPVDDLRGT